MDREGICNELNRKSNEFGVTAGGFDAGGLFYFGSSARFSS